MSLGKILIVEDEKDIRDLLGYALRREGFTVFEAADGNRAVELALAEFPDIVLLDLMLPGLDGFGVCKVLQQHRQTASIPVLMLTAKGEEVDKIVGFELGAADYVVKPFSVREVLLRVRAILRRSNGTEAESNLRCEGIFLDQAAHTALVRGVPADLTITEFRLLADLLRNRGRVRTREQLLESVWGYSFDGYARTVDTHIRRLRAKLGEEAESIETVRGMGYRAKLSNRVETGENQS